MPTVIVASDAPSVRAEVVAVLGDEETSIVEAASGREALRAVAEYAPDLVVLDLQMGSMGAVAVCLDLRLAETLEPRFGGLEHVPVLMLLDRRPDVFMARRAGAEGWIVKPLDPIRIRRAAAALLAGGEFHDESFQPVPVVVAPSLPAVKAATGPAD